MNNARNTASVGLSAMNALCNNGTIVVYDGTEPATPQTALSSNTALATFTFSATAFDTPAYSGGFMQSNPSFVATSVNPTAGGTASFARVYKSDGTTVVNDLTVGTSGTDLTIGSTTITMGVPVTVSGLVSRLPAV